MRSTPVCLLSKREAVDTFRLLNASCAAFLSDVLKSRWAVQKELVGKEVTLLVEAGLKTKEDIGEFSPRPASVLNSVLSSIRDTSLRVYI